MAGGSFPRRRRCQWTADLKPSSRRTYRKLLDNQILPAFERAALGGVDTLAVREWLV